MKNVCLLLIASLALTACAGDSSVKVSSLQRKDKGLSCTEIMLEVNEAEFYRKTAENNKNPKLKNLLMPLGYVSTYVGAEEAIDAASARVEYLNRIYDILGCEAAAEQQAKATRYPVAAPNPYAGYTAGPAGYYPPAPVPQMQAYQPQPMVHRMSGQYYYSQPEPAPTYW